MMGCRSCGGKPAAAVDPRRGVRGQWTVIYPHGAIQPFPTREAAEAKAAGRYGYIVVDPDLNPVGEFDTAADIASSQD